VENERVCTNLVHLTRLSLKLDPYSRPVYFRCSVPPASASSDYEGGVEINNQHPTGSKFESLESDISFHSVIGQGNWQLPLGNLGVVLTWLESSVF